jgi:hypothetical protein
MSWIRFNLTLATIVAMTVSAALLQGRMRHRWGPSDAARKAAACLRGFPSDFGDWHMASASELDEESRRQLAPVGEIVRSYKNAKTGERVILLLILGPTGPTAAHTPEVCMGEREFAPLGSRREVEVVKGSDDRFWNKRFKVKDVHGELLSVYWAWSAGRTWIAAENARFRFAGLPVLYKAQVTCGFQGPADGDRDDGGRRFLEAFVPEAEKYLVPNIKD